MRLIPAAPAEQGRRPTFSRTRKSRPSWRVRRAWDTHTKVNKKQDLYPECGLAQGTTHNSAHQYERGWGGDRGDMILSFGLRGKAGL